MPDTIEADAEFLHFLQIQRVCRIHFTDKALAESMGERAKNIVNEYDAKVVCRQWEEYLVSVAEN